MSAINRCCLRVRSQMREIKSKGLLAMAFPEVREMFELIENTFDPLGKCKVSPSPPIPVSRGSPLVSLARDALLSASCWGGSDTPPPCSA